MGAALGAPDGWRRYQRIKMGIFYSYAGMPRLLALNADYMQRKT